MFMVVSHGKSVVRHYRVDNNIAQPLIMATNSIFLPSFLAFLAILLPLELGLLSNRLHKFQCY